MVDKAKTPKITYILEHIKDPLTFMCDLSLATQSCTTKFGPSERAKVDECLRFHLPITFYYLGEDIRKKLKPQERDQFLKLTNEAEHFKSELQKYRSSETILDSEHKNSEDLLESLYVSMLNRAVVAYYYQLARRCGIKRDDLKNAYPEDADFLEQDFELIGEKLVQNKTPEVVSIQISKVFDGTRDFEEPTAIMSLFHLRITEMLNRPELIKDTTEAFKYEKYHVVRKSDNTPQGRVLTQAREAMFALLSQNLDTTKRIIRHYHLLDLTEEKITQLGERKYFDEDISPEQVHNVKEHLKTLFPTKVVVSPLTTWGCTMFNGDICVSDEILNEFEYPKKIIGTMFVIMHEIAHLKKMKVMAKGKYLFKTPDSLKVQVAHLRPGTTGTLWEKDSFGNIIWIENIDHEIAETLITHLQNQSLTAEVWDEIVRVLIKDPKEPKEGSEEEAGESSEKRRSRKFVMKKCGTEDIIRDLMKEFKHKIYL